MPESQPVRSWAGVRCAECGRKDDSDERGWKAYLADADLLHPDGGNGRSALETWEETSDFQANGVLRLLYLYADKTWAPDPSDPGSVEPVVPCDLQWDARNQLLGYKYFGDEPAGTPMHPATQRCTGRRTTNCCSPPPSTSPDS